ncbi:hypothetical protein DPMN_187588 [Dreissena polymorpha]|uniref:Uncharacterized protein n=1 Tax=Dreissena polymorpha TaxID=45954 RepID=A0A9D4DPC2_DREPO|nr:hypothetical protein DPMN_187588 [Dreissena polymorpha]
MYKTDFVSWDDEDLLLGDYTDSDEYCDSEFVQASTQSVVYECPECNKLMKSISGFRGRWACCKEA